MDNRQLGGWGFLVGNLAVIANGMIAYFKGDTEKTRQAGVGRAATGLLWNGGALILTRYGDQPINRQFERLQSKLTHFMEQEGIPLEVAELKRATAEQQRGWFSKFEDFLYNYPIECNNIYNTAVTAGMLYSGIRRRQDGKTGSGNMNIACSAFVLAGTLASILIPEKTKEQIAEKSQSGTIWGKLQEAPLHYAVWLFLASDLSEGVNAYTEFGDAKKLDKDNPFRPWAFAMSGLSAVAMTSFMASDSLTGFGSKKASGEPAERDEAREKLLDVAAQILARQPEKSREELLTKTIAYMSKQPELRMTDFIPDKLKAQMLERIKKMETEIAAAPVTGNAAPSFADKISTQTISAERFM